MSQNIGQINYESERKRMASAIGSDGSGSDKKKMLPSETEAQHFENSFEILNYICNYMDG
jgi:hypothetical protein